MGLRLGPAPCSTPSAGRPQVRELIDKVRAVFVEALDELRWMDAPSKKKAQEKVGGHWRPEAGASRAEGAVGHLTHFSVRSERGVAGPREDCGQRQAWKPVLGDPPAPWERVGWPWPHGAAHPAVRPRPTGAPLG